MSKKLLRHLNSNLIKLVSRSTGLNITYNSKNNTIRIDNGKIYVLNNKKKDELIELISL